MRLQPENPHSVSSKAGSAEPLLHIEGSHCMLLKSVCCSSAMS